MRHAKLNSVATYTTVNTVIFELASLSLCSSTHFNKSGNQHKTETNPLTVTERRVTPCIMAVSFLSAPYNLTATYFSVQL
jgi:hypothetical protein